MRTDSCVLLLGVHVRLRYMNVNDDATCIMREVRPSEQRGSTYIHICPSSLLGACGRSAAATARQRKERRSNLNGSIKLLDRHQNTSTCRSAASLIQPEVVAGNRRPPATSAPLSFVWEWQGLKHTASNLFGARSGCLLHLQSILGAEAAGSGPASNILHNQKLSDSDSCCRTQA